jgi:hypothetical protein
MQIPPFATNELFSIVVGPVISVILAWLVAKATKHDREVERERQIAKIEFMVQQLWIRVFKSGVVEGLDKGILEMNSPLSSSLEAWEGYDSLVKRLREWYEHEGKQLKDLDLLVAVDRKFESDLVKISLDHKLIGGAALASVCFLLRPEMGLFDRHVLREWKLEKEKEGE